MRSNPTCQHTPTRGYQGTVSIHGSLGTGAFSNSPALYFSLTSPRTLSGPPPPVPGMVLGTPWTPSPYPEPAEGSKVAFGRLLLLPVTKKGLLFGPEKTRKTRDANTGLPSAADEPSTFSACNDAPAPRQHLQYHRSSLLSSKCSLDQRE